MLLAVNIGNSSTQAGFFFQSGGEEPFIHRFPTHPLEGAREYFRELEDVIEKLGIGEQLERDGRAGMVDRPHMGALCSVVPSHNDVFLELIELMLGKYGGEKAEKAKKEKKAKQEEKPVIIDHKTAAGMRFDVENPAALGADRIASGYGAWKMYGGPVCVVDTGTATTLNFITADGLFLGGAIMPGLGLMRDSLQSGTAALPYVDLAVEQKKPRLAIGTNTSGSILSGIIYGTVGAISRIIEEAELLRLEKFKIALTGGYAGLIAPYLKRLDFHEPALALKGIRRICLAAL